MVSATRAGRHVPGSPGGRGRPAGGRRRPLDMLTARASAAAPVLAGAPMARSSLKLPPKVMSPAARAAPKRSPASACPGSPPAPWRRTRTPPLPRSWGCPGTLELSRTVTRPAAAAPATVASGAPTARSTARSKLKSAAARAAPKWAPARGGDSVSSGPPVMPFRPVEDADRTGVGVPGDGLAGHPHGPRPVGVVVETPTARARRTGRRARPPRLPRTAHLPERAGAWLSPP